MAIKAYIIHNFSPRWFINCNIVLCRRGHWLNNRNVCFGIMEWKNSLAFSISFFSFKPSTVSCRLAEKSCLQVNIWQAICMMALYVCIAYHGLLVFAWVTCMKTCAHDKVHWSGTHDNLFLGPWHDTGIWMWLDCHALLALHSPHLANSFTSLQTRLLVAECQGRARQTSLWYSTIVAHI